jgi:hypothetical protein
LTASIIAPTAAKPATFAPLKPMTAERVRIECALQEDARLLAAVPLIVSHAAHLAGISEKAARNFGDETAEVCRTALACISKAEENPAIDFVVDQFQDRIEVVLQVSGEKFSPADCDGALRSVADRVHHENTAGKSRLTITKFCGALPKQTK